MTDKTEKNIYVCAHEKPGATCLSVASNFALSCKFSRKNLVHSEKIRKFASLNKCFTL